MKLALIGATDLTLKVAEFLREKGTLPSAIMTAEQTFSINYQKTDVINVRHVDVAGWARENRIPCEFYKSADCAYDFFVSNPCDIALVVGWYHMIPARVRGAFRYGALGIHASLLPKLRGGAPLNWAILSGMKETGVTLFQLSDGVDDGEVFGQKQFPINSNDYVSDLISKTEEASLHLVDDLLRAAGKGSVCFTKQVGQPSYCLQRRPEDGLIVWGHHSDAITRLVRAVSCPYPGAYTFLGGRKIKILGAELYDGMVMVLGNRGQIINIPDHDGPLVVTGSGVIKISRAAFEDGADALPLLRKSSHQRFDSVGT